MPRPPLAVSWDLLYACNAACGFCGTHELHRSTGAPSEEELLRIAEAIGRAGVRVVGLSGGEPLLVKNLGEVLRTLRAFGSSIQVNTNGGLLAERADDLFRARVDSVTVSIDSVDADEHDRRRGSAGLHRRLEEGLAALSERRGRHRILRRVRFVVTPESAGELTAFVEKWRPLVDEVCLQPLMRHGPLLRGFRESPRHEPSAREDLEDSLARLGERFPELRTGYYRGMPEFVFGDGGAGNDFDCLVPAFMVQVTPHGDVKLCTNEASLGNLLETDLLELWNDHRARALRDKSRRRCRDCFCYCQWLRINDSVPQSSLRRWIPVRREDGS